MGDEILIQTFDGEGSFEERDRMLNEIREGGLKSFVHFMLSRKGFKKHAKAKQPVWKLAKNIFHDASYKEFCRIYDQYSEL